MRLSALLTCAFIGAVGVGVSGCALRSEPPLVVKCKEPPRGTRSSGPALVGVDYGMQATPIPLDSVQYTDWRTARKVSLQSLMASRTPTNTVRVTARFISCDSESVSVRVRTSFVDAGQAPTEPTSVWRTVIVPPHLTATYSETSTSSRPVNYLVEVSSGE